VGSRTLIILDTHVLLWWVSGVERLSTKARRAITAALKYGPVHVSAISLFEIATALRRGRLEVTVAPDQMLRDLRALTEVSFESVTADIAQAAGRLGADFPGDPADRLIVCTASLLGASLVSADDRLRNAPGISVIW
jgi:PIN domain nuclease of toxin-antitoxin system